MIDEKLGDGIGSLPDNLTVTLILKKPRKRPLKNINCNSPISLQPSP